MILGGTGGDEDESRLGTPTSERFCTAEQAQNQEQQVFHTENEKALRIVKSQKERAVEKEVKQLTNKLISQTKCSLEPRNVGEIQIRREEMDGIWREETTKGSSSFSLSLSVPLGRRRAKIGGKCESKRRGWVRD